MKAQQIAAVVLVPVLALGSCSAIDSERIREAITALGDPPLTAVPCSIRDGDYVEFSATPGVRDSVRLGGDHPDYFVLPTGAIPAPRRFRLTLLPLPVRVIEIDPGAPGPIRFPVPALVSIDTVGCSPVGVPRDSMHIARYDPATQSLERLPTVEGPPGRLVVQVETLSFLLIAVP